MIRRKFYHLPALLCLLLLAVTGCEQKPPITEPVKIVVFGDSLTEGYNIRTEQAVPARLQAHFLAAGHTGVRIMNMGISGDTTRGGLARLNLVLNESPDIVLLELGANDLMRRTPAKDAQTNLRAMIEALQEQDITVILCGVKVPAIFVIGNPHMAEYPPMYDDLADIYDLPYYPNFLKGVLGEPKMLLEDQLHPSAAGAQEIADRIYPLVLESAHATAAKKRPSQ